MVFRLAQRYNAVLAIIAFWVRLSLEEINLFIISNHCRAVLLAIAELFIGNLHTVVTRILSISSAVLLVFGHMACPACLVESDLCYYVPK